MIHFNNSISDSYFQSYYGRNLSTNKKGTFIALTSSDEFSRSLGAGKSFALDFSIATTNGVFPEDFGVTDIHLVIGEFSNLQCVTDTDEFTDAGITENGSLRKLSNDQDNVNHMDNLYCKLLPVEYGVSFNSIETGSVCDEPCPRCPDDHFLTKDEPTNDGNAHEYCNSLLGDATICKRCREAYDFSQLTCPATLKGGNFPITYAISWGNYWGDKGPSVTSCSMHFCTRPGFFNH